MRNARFPGVGVAVAPLALVFLLGGCSDLTSPPPNDRDAGRDLSVDGRGTGGSDTAAEDTRDSDLASTDGSSGDRVVLPGSDDAGRLGEAGNAGSGGNGGAAGAGGTGGNGGTTIDSSNRDGGVASDGPRVFEADAAGVSADGAPGLDGNTDISKETDNHFDTAPGALSVNAGADATVCAGAPATLGASVQGGKPPFVYAWTADPACSNCIVTPKAAQTTISPRATTTFKLTVTDSVGATASDSLVVTVINPVANAGAELVTLKPGESVQLGAPAQTGTTYAWSCDRPTCALSNPAAAQPTVSPNLSTLYTLKTTSPEGCIATASTTVWVNLPVTTTPSDGATYPRTEPILVQFGAPVLASSLAGTAIALRESASQKSVDFDYAYDATSHLLSITPKGRSYNAAIAEYTLTLKGGASGILSDDPILPQRLPGDVVLKYTITKTLFSDNFESGTGKWTLTPPWGLTTSVSSSPSHSLTDSPAGDYGAMATSATTTPIDIAGVVSVTLSYWVSGTLATYDSVSVEYSTATSGGWNPAATLTDLSPGTRSHTIPLGTGATQLRIRFTLIPSMFGFTRADGIYLDDVLVQAN